MTASDDFPRDLGLNVAGYVRQYEEMCHEIDTLRAMCAHREALIVEYESEITRLRNALIDHMAEFHPPQAKP